MCIYDMFRLVLVLEIAVSVDFPLLSGLRFSFVSSINNLLNIAKDIAPKHVQIIQIIELFTQLVN